MRSSPPFYPKLFPQKPFKILHHGNQDGDEDADNPHHSTAFDHTSESSKHLLQVEINDKCRENNQTNVNHKDTTELELKNMKLNMPWSREERSLYILREVEPQTVKCAKLLLSKHVCNLTILVK